eukprot:TRINITY_DN66826_c11_g6_i1.p1 TRINITY_DN66826_c11_g6~~TRINITY_DN66826_c11_g6_i1.p1  ORF type:complete len:640 (-),score=-7.17 TRINITY_DN66826_c11_g6_i1:549-2468(-)
MSVVDYASEIEPDVGTGYDLTADFTGTEGSTFLKLFWAACESTVHTANLWYDLFSYVVHQALPYWWMVWNVGVAAADVGWRFASHVDWRVWACLGVTLLAYALYCIISWVLRKWIIPWVRDKYQRTKRFIARTKQRLAHWKERWIIRPYRATLRFLKASLPHLLFAALVAIPHFGLNAVLPTGMVDNLIANLFLIPIVSTILPLLGSLFAILTDKQTLIARFLQNWAVSQSFILVQRMIPDLLVSTVTSIVIPFVSPFVSPFLPEAVLNCCSISKEVEFYFYIWLWTPFTLGTVILFSFLRGTVDHLETELSSTFSRLLPRNAGGVQGVTGALSTSLSSIKLVLRYTLLPVLRTLQIPKLLGAIGGVMLPRLMKVFNILRKTMVLLLTCCFLFGPYPLPAIGCTITGLALPIYTTVKLCSGKPTTASQLQQGGGGILTSASSQQLLYWVTYVPLMLWLEAYVDPVFGWVPLYYHVKLCVLIWLQMPSEDYNGALWFFKHGLAALFSFGSSAPKKDKKGDKDKTKSSPKGKKDPKQGQDQQKDKETGKKEEPPPKEDKPADASSSSTSLQDKEKEGDKDAEEPRLTDHDENYEQDQEPEGEEHEEEEDIGEDTPAELKAEEPTRGKGKPHQRKGFKAGTE